MVVHQRQWLNDAYANNHHYHYNKSFRHAGSFRRD